MNEAVPIRDAATIILVRDAETAPRVLMGQRGRGAVFLPDKFVFPGGATDAEDAQISVVERMPEPCRTRLGVQSETVLPETLGLTAIRELWEETALALATKAHFQSPADSWADFADAGWQPGVSALRFFFRAVTPPGRPRRFDARFFIADAARLVTDPDSLPEATEELSHLRWVLLEEAAELDLAFVTRLVLAELADHLPSLDAPKAVPFLKNDAFDNEVVWL